MNIKGKVSRVTDLKKFLGTFVKTGKADPSAVTPMHTARVSVVTNFPFNTFDDIIPGTSGFTVSRKVNAQGRFNVPLPDAPPIVAAKAFILVFRQIATVPLPLGGTFPILAPVYRSAAFPLAAIKDQDLDISVAIESAPPGSGITQDEVTKEAADFGKQSKMDLTAIIRNGSVNAVAKARGATITFDINLGPSVSADLNEFLDAEVGPIDIDLPGPFDFITQLCVDEDKIRSSIRNGVARLATEFNGQVKDEIIKGVAAETGLPPSQIAAFLDEKSSLTFQDVSFPVTSVVDVGFLTVHLRSIVGTPCFGFPRVLVS